MQEQPHWRRMLLRSKETADAYDKELETRTSGGECKMCEDKEAIFEEFKYWVMMENRFPYDRYFSKSHMLVTKRHTDELNLSTEEEAEFQELRYGYLAENYDSMFDHLPKQKSIPGHCHMHVVQIKPPEGV